MRPIPSGLPRSIAVLALAVSAGGCSFKIPGEARLGTTSHFEVPAVEQEAVGELRWGLALSGGGLRSAVFSMGVLKGLHDSRLMDSVQVISSVSGGGYTAYWLYTREYASDFAGAFGDNTFPDDRFKVGMCEVLVRGNFYSYGEMLKTLRPGGETYVQGYDRALLRTFGQAMHTPETKVTGVIEERHPLHFHELREGVRTREMPYLIVNTTMVRPRPTGGWEAGLYEFTPLLSGNERYGYHAWRDTSTELRQAIGISGAAVRPVLKQEIPNPHYALGQPTHFTMSDGGHSENLGAIALIRRRVKNIIIVDAEHDPPYEFEGYGILRDRLRSWGYALAVPSIDHRVPGARLRSGTHVGVVRSMVPGDSFSANIYYVKMSLPMSLDPVISDPQAYARGQAVRARVFAALRNGPRVRPRDWDCDNLSAVDVNFHDWFVYQVRAYSTFRPRASQFPQYTTFDQSYYLDQSEAFIGLGYFQALELSRTLRGR